MKIIYNRLLPFGKRYYAINLFGVLFAKGPCDKFTINHELIHTAQIKELCYIFFYLAYLIEWFVRILYLWNGFEAYKRISFEREAYANDRNLDYLSSRKHFSFLKYIGKKE